MDVSCVGVSAIAGTEAGLGAGFEGFVFYRYLSKDRLDGATRGT